MVVCFLCPWPDFFLIRMHHSQVWRKWALIINHLSWPALPCRGWFSWDSSKNIPEEAKVSSPKVHGHHLACCPATSSSNTELYNLVVTTAKAAPSLHIPTRLPCWLLWGQSAHHSLWDPPRSVAGSYCQCFPGTSWMIEYCCTASPADVRGLKSSPQEPRPVTFKLAANCL